MFQTRFSKGSSAGCLAIFCVGGSVLLAACSDGITAASSRDGELGQAREALSASELDLEDVYYLGQHLAGGATEAGDEFGAVFASGDLNGDGIADLVSSTRSEDSNQTGAVFFFDGAAGGVHRGRAVKQSDAGQSNTSDSYLGWSLAVGDFNGDGFDDVAAGAPGKAKGTAKNVGKVFVWYGAAGSVVKNTAPGVSFWSSQVGCGSDEQGDEFGYALAAGDFNADGLDDLAVGVPGENSTTGQTVLGQANGQGQVCIIKGAGNGLEQSAGKYYFQNTNGYVAAAREAGDRYGHALAAATFTDGGHVDVAAGAPGENGGEGVVIVLFGKSTADVTHFFSGGNILDQADAGGSAEAGDGFGSALAAGNFNGDAWVDLAIGAPTDRVAGNTSGAFYTFAGAPGGPTQGQVFDQSDTGASNESGDEFGYALAAGDFNDDGVDDLVVGAPGEAPGSKPAGSGMVAIFGGSAGGLSQGNWYDQEQLGGASETNDRMGAGLGAADVDGDGAADVVVGAPNEGPFGDPNGGFVFIIPGRTQSPGLSLGPRLGAVTADSVKVWVRANRSGRFLVEYWPSACGSSCSLTSASAPLDGATDETGTLTLSGLSAGTEYGYRVKLAEPSGGTYTVVAESSFRTLSLGAGELKFAVGADLNEYQVPFTIFDEIAARNVDFMLSIGDQIYADRAYDTARTYEAFYRSNWSDPSFRSFQSAFPTLLTWDDHEISNDWYPTKPGVAGRYANARIAYDEYQGSANPSPMSSGELYYSFEARDVGFFVLDTRSHRSPSTGSMLGSGQLSQLFSWLQTSTAKFKFIVSSVPFHDYSTTGGDSWNGLSGCTNVGRYLSERTALFDFIRTNEIPGVVLLSGDQHWAGAFTEPSAAPYSLYEFMPTPLGIGPRSLPGCSQGSDVLDMRNGEKYFGLFTADTSSSPATLDYQLIDSQGNLQYALLLTEQDIGL